MTKNNIRLSTKENQKDFILRKFQKTAGNADVSSERTAFCDTSRPEFITKNWFLELPSRFYFRIFSVASLEIRSLKTKNKENIQKEQNTKNKETISNVREIISK